MDLEIKRLDHLGIIAGVIKDLKLIESIDQRLQKDKNGQEMITPGEAIAGMIMNGLGFSEKITHGYSKDSRSDLKQIVHE